MPQLPSWEKKPPTLTYVLVAMLTAMVMVAETAFAGLTAKDIADLKEQGLREGWTFEVGENPATEYSLDQLCGVKVPIGWETMAPFDASEPSANLPTSYDWRSLNGCTPVKNQGGCGSCWAFSTVGALECNIKIREGITVDLSEQWLVSCNADGWDCDGGWLAHDYHMYKTDMCSGTGAVPESSFPYQARNGTCACPYPHTYQIRSWAYLVGQSAMPGVAQMKQAIIDHGPISVLVSANSAMQAYRGGIFNACNNGSLNHAVVIVGWDDNQGSAGVWIMRNSWGTGWGEGGGYMRIPYGCSLIGTGSAYVNYVSKRPLAFTYPAGVPIAAAPGQPTAFEVVVSGVNGGVPISGTGQLHYRLNGGPVLTSSMTEIGTNRYEATLPLAGCGDRYEFYVSAQDEYRGRVLDTDSTCPHIALAATTTTQVFDDNFQTDLGWTVSGNATDGQWSRGGPVGGGDRGVPPRDFDLSGYCFLTDNVTGESDVDAGSTVLTSPAFDVTGGELAVIRYARWYSNDYSTASYSDTFKVYVSGDDGATWTTVETVGPTSQASGSWYHHEFVVNDYVSPGSQTRIRFEASDLGSASNIEAAVDAVQATVYDCSGILDSDSDGVPDVADNCPYVASLSQEDVDGDGIGDVCDNCLNLVNPSQIDADHDGVGEVCDNCPSVPNESQEDADADDVGDLCDNCLTTPNQGQENADGDASGDACDVCPGDATNDASDHDGVCDNIDNCLSLANVGQEDNDGDGRGNACDNCPDVPNLYQSDRDLDGLGDACDACPDDSINDADLDGVCGNADNCVTTANPDQADRDHDGKGDACDDDSDNDGIPDGQDNCPYAANTDQADATHDGIGDCCCCVGIRGNINGDVLEKINVSDVTYLTGYLFSNGAVLPPPSCPK